jgi:CHASE2 domain-containing sensor protein
MSTPTPNDLGSVVSSAKARKAIYGVYVVGILIIGAIQVGFAALSAAQPDWLTVALAVGAYLGVPVGALAAANTNTR